MSLTLRAGGIGTCALALLAAAPSSAPAQEAQRYIGSNQTEEFTDLKAVRDAAGAFDGYIACGYREFGPGGDVARDFYVSRLRPDGTELWAVRWGSNDRDEATSVVQTADLGFAVVGETAIPVGGGALGLGILKLDSAGNFQWARLMVGGGFGERIAVQLSRTPGPAARATSNGEVALVGYQRISAVSLEQRGVYYRWSVAGVPLASRSYLDGTAPLSQMTLTDLRELNPAGDLGIVGTILVPVPPPSPTTFDHDPLYLRIDAAGNPTLARTYPTFGAGARRALEAGDGVEFIGGSLVMSGFTDFSIPGPNTVTGTHLLRLNPATGAPAWMTRFSEFYNGYAAVGSDSGNGDVLVGGYLQNLGTLPRPTVASLLRADGAGNLVWNRGYFWPGANSTAGTGVAQPAVPGRPIALIGMGLQPAPYGSLDGYFVRANNFGLTGCLELSREPRVEGVQVDPRTQAILSSALTTTAWLGTFSAVTSLTTAVCTGVGCCGLADVTGIGGQGPPCDGQLTVDDIIVYFNAFSDGVGCPGASPCNLADVTGIGGPPALPDGQLTVDDIIAFINAFGDGCQ